MSGAHRAERTRGARRRPLTALLLAGAVLLGLTGGPGTLAYWNDTETVQGGVVTAGSLDLTVEGVQGPYTWAGLQMSDLVPGESVAAELTIQNAGTTPFTVVLTGTATGGLAPHVTATAYVGGTATSDETYPRAETCEGAAPGTAGTLGATARPLTSPVTVGVPTGPGTGEATLCVVLALPPTTAPAAQGTSITPSFAITATQAQS